ncbi:alginate biosynthesis transcriptional regulatory protein AlgB [Peptococcaceae bacterium CEB3]|nr:alginate biosynthesis transcriptional regulatory protein AlgB [Peptococcaceae bacterium CEB3]
MNRQEKPVRVLLVDDEASFVYFLSARLERRGFDVAACASGEDGLFELSRREFDVAILDLRLPGLNGLDLLEQMKGMLPEIEVIMLTGFGSIDTATEAMRRGAYDYLTKPCSAARLELLIEKAAEKKRLAEQARGLSEAQRRQSGSRPLIGQSPGMRQVIQMVRQVADGEAPILILGESGTGKELVARSLHFWSRRRRQPFQPLNTAAIPAQLVESELFGHAKGAFTGAASAKTGFVEDAEGGTLFLDEIGELDPSVQAKLLRFLESGEFRRVGENRIRSVRVRAVAATNRDLAREVQAGNFRADLYYRLNVVTIRIPPLRERPEDIAQLAGYFLRTNRQGNGGKELSPGAIEALQEYEFPGNVRELANLIERGILLAPGRVIEAEHLFFNAGSGERPGSEPWLAGRPWTRPDEGPAGSKKGGSGLAPKALYSPPDAPMGSGADGSALVPEAGESTAADDEPRRMPAQGAVTHAGPRTAMMTLAEVERRHIERVLNLTEGNKTRAAALLGIGLRTLYRKIEEYGLAVPAGEKRSVSK